MSMTSKPSSERPGASWRKEEKRAPLRWLCAYPGSLTPEHIQILTGSVPGRRSLIPLNLEELYDIFALSTGCLSGPQIYVKEHLAPAGDLPFQLGLKGVPLAQEETIHLLLGGFYARCSTEQVVDLAGGPPGPLFLAVTLWFVLSHEKRLLACCTRYPPFCGAEPKRRRRLEEASTYTLDANGYQATSSDRCFL
jgi:hypothetical protein